MSYRTINVKRYKRGASWPDGKPRMCTRCSYEKEDAGRRKRAVVIGELQYTGSKFKTPVSYCEDHIPANL